MEDVKSFVIDRKTWHRGNMRLLSRLVVEATGRMCCLGSYGLACGLTKEQMFDKATPTSLTRSGIELPPSMRWLVTSYGVSNRGKALMEANDDAFLSDKDREKRIISLFHEQGITVTFIN